MIHKHIAKHAKRTHKHVQDHGHKWLRLLSGVFFFILIYPYFSNAQVPATCQNGATNTPDCTICAQGYTLDESEQCVEDANPTDLCSNIDGIQETIPAGQELNDDNECVPEEAGDEATEVIALTGNIVYNPTTNTTGTVTATVVGFSTTGVTITNNSGNNTYVFTGNGSFTFTLINEQGTAGSATATVDWMTTTPEVVTTIQEECEVQIESPISGVVIGGELDIIWSSDNCDEDQQVTLQLRDHNSQWITIGTGILEDEELSFNSTGLASTGFYTITGVHLSGTTHSGVTYNQDTIYNIYTGQATGAYTDFATGYKIRIVNTDEAILAESNGTFTIDNKNPTLSSLTGSFAPLFNGYIGKASIMTASFTTTEQLTGAIIFTILGTTVTPTSVVQTGYTYSFTIPLSSVMASGSLAFTAHVTDLAGNTGAIYGTSSIVLNNNIPAISNFTFTTGTASASGSINLSWNTNISTRYNLSFYKSGTVGTTYFTGTTYGTSHTYTMTNIQNGHQYPFILTALNNVDNNSILQGTLQKSTTGVLSISLQSSNDILQLSGQAETNLYLQILQNEINKFQVCKATITLTNQTIPVGNKSVVIRIPTITSNSVKQTMLTFLLLFTNKVQEKTTLSQAELNIVADAVNNFLVVIKLVDDDNNNCEQKMSTYYLSQFEQLMSSMNFF